MASVVLRGVEKTYTTGQRALAPLDLAVADGELLVLVGPSGCGKSTLLRIVAGLERPTQGRVLIGELDVTDRPPQARDLAMVFQSYALYPHKTVKENLGFGLRMARQPRRDIDARVGRMAEVLELGEILDRKPAQLSGGQRQRVALGRALVREPKCFLLDEPLSNLDAALRLQMRAEISRLQQRFGTTTIYVTHDQEEALTLGTRIAVLRKGQLEQLGPPLDVYDHPATLFVARFIGSPPMNVFRCTAERCGDGVRLRSPALVSPVDLSSTPFVEEDVDLAVRPHELELVDPSAAHLAATAEVVQPLGSETLVHSAVGGTRFTLVLRGDAHVRRGDSLSVRVPEGSAHLFSHRSGQRIDGR
jgi:multiple sugar transport system ATP-binding protein